MAQTIGKDIYDQLVAGVPIAGTADVNVTNLCTCTSDVNVVNASIPVTQSGIWNITNLASITSTVDVNITNTPVPITGTISVTYTPTGTQDVNVINPCSCTQDVHLTPGSALAGTVTVEQASPGNLLNIPYFWDTGATYRVPKVDSSSRVVVAGTVDANQYGTWNINNLASITSTVDVNITNLCTCTQDVNITNASLPVTQSGTWNITNLASITSTVDVSVTNLCTCTQDVNITSTVNVQQTDPNYLKPLIYGIDGVNLRPVVVDGSGNLILAPTSTIDSIASTVDVNVTNLCTCTSDVNVVNASIPVTQSGTWNITNLASITSTVDVSVVTSLPSGSNAIGKLVANSGVDIGDVTVNNAGGASAVNIQDGGNVISVDDAGGSLTVDQGTASNLKTEVHNPAGQGLSVLNYGYDGSAWETLNTDTKNSLEITSTAATIIATTSTAVTTSAGVIVSANSSRRSVAVTHITNATLYIGPSGVTTSNGFPLEKNQVFTDGGIHVFNGAIYGICASGTIDVRYLETT